MPPEVAKVRKVAETSEVPKVSKASRIPGQAAAAAGKGADQGGNAAPPREDGRTLRSAATRRAVAEAYLDLLEDGEMRPTARAIAERAGFSERAVFRHFQDLENLHSEAAVLQIARMSREIPDPAPTSGPLPGRAATLARRWCTIHERVTPVRRVAVLQEPFSKEIARRLAWSRGVQRDEIEQTFSVELRSLEAEQRRRRLAALCAVASWESWMELRRRQDLDADASTAIVEEMLVSILGASSPDPESPAQSPK